MLLGSPCWCFDYPQLMWCCKIAAAVASETQDISHLPFSRAADPSIQLLEHCFFSMLRIQFLRLFCKGVLWARICELFLI